ncbi:MAG: hypothetical protein NC413_05270 [Muribaculum sp.]|nr:hypothetical protein [Muribaculum sp.]
MEAWLVLFGSGLVLVRSDWFWLGAAGENWEEFCGRAAVGCFLIVRGGGLQFAGRL